MFNIKILAIGKIKEKYYGQAIDEYLKRLKPYAKIEMHELKAESFGSGDKARAKEAEGERILKFLEKHPDSEIVIMDENGKNFTSQEFAALLENINKQIIFVIGGSLGLSERILQNKYQKISLSKMTFPHELARVVLVEQIYRAVTILKGKEYHY